MDTRRVTRHLAISAFGLVAMIGCGETGTDPSNSGSQPPPVPAVGEVTLEVDEDETMDEKPWRTDPALSGRFHPDYPDDLQVIVHDGGPRFTEKPPELIWVTVTAKDHQAFRGTVLNQPQGLESIVQGDEILFLAVSSAEHPFQVSEKYLRERAEWVIKPCGQCGFSELFDPPSDLIRKVFPDVGTNSKEELEVFTSFCPLCGGVQVIHRPGFDGECWIADYQGVSRAAIDSLRGLIDI